MTTSTCGIPVPATVRINGRALVPADGEDEQVLRERTWVELLRQRAVGLGLLDETGGGDAPKLDTKQHAVLETLMDREVLTPEPSDEACQRYYDAHKAHFRHGQWAHVRHILFAVTPKVPVKALAQRAEALLLDLLRADGTVDAFTEAAARWSNCPSGAQGGDLGWIRPSDCVPELSQFLFGQEGGVAPGIQPRLVQTRFGLHIIDVQAQQPGELAPVASVMGRIRSELCLRSRATALRHYLQLLAGQARIEGLTLAAAGSPLVQ